MPRVEVVDARPDAQRIVALDLPAGATVADAVRASGLLAGTPPPAALGVFGRRVAPGRRLEEGDRVELYRALTAEPGLARRRRAARGTRR